MSSQTSPPGERIWDVVLTSFRLTLHLQDGRSVGAPLSWFPRLQEGTQDQRKNWRVGRDRLRVEWPDLGEGVSAADLLRGAATTGETRRRAGG